MRHFDIQNEKHGETGGWRKVAIILCGGCGRKGMVPIQTKATVLPDELVSKKFTAIDWYVGPIPKKDLCPECIREAKTNGAKKMLNGNGSGGALASQQAAIEAQIIAEKPREMGREDRRIIFQALTDHYVNEKVGYSKDWSDHRIATDLGVPRKWVETVRDEMFGPISANPEMQAFLDEYKLLHGDATAILQRAVEVRKQVDAILGDHLFANVQQILDRQSALDKLADKIRKHGIS